MSGCVAGIAPQARCTPTRRDDTIHSLQRQNKARSAEGCRKVVLSIGVHTPPPKGEYAREKILDNLLEGVLS
jgi:hypothetical protein